MSRVIQSAHNTLQSLHLSLVLDMKNSTLVVRPYRTCSQPCLSPGCSWAKMIYAATRIEGLCSKGDDTIEHHQSNGVLNGHNVGCNFE